jgi:hypothetical protein
MANNQFYLAVGEEAARGTAESTTVGFIPLNNPGEPTLEPDDQPRAEYRGEESALGDRLTRRLGKKWSTSLEIPFFTEAGTTAGMMGTILKHFFGDATSAQNASTGQYYHMMYPVSDPFATGNLDNDALTLNCNWTKDASTVKNHPWTGGRVTGLTFTQEPGQLLVMSATMNGQQKDAAATAIAAPTYAAENLRCDYADLTIYTGTITRTGSGPDYTAYAFGSATAIKPDRFSLTLSNGMTDKMRLEGLTYPNKTTLGKFTGEIELTIDLDDPSSGFSSYDDFIAWAEATAGDSTTNFFMHYDTGTQAGTGDNHSLYLDLPRAQRLGGTPARSLESDPTISLKYKCEFDAATTNYLVGCMLKNTASAV